MEKDDATWLNVGYLAFLALSAYIGYSFAETLGVQLGWMERFEWYGAVATLAGLVIGVGATWYLRADGERHEYFLSAISELRKVSWPTWTDTKRMTVIVCIVVAIFSVIMSVFDILWAKTLRLLIA